MMLYSSTQLVEVYKMETKTKKTAIKKTTDGHLFVLEAKVDGKNVGDVGFLVHRRIEHLIDSTEVLSPRLAILRLRIDKRTTVSIINCYAPTSTANDGEKDAFYKELEEVTKNERSYYKYVVGDFNAVIHEESPATARTGPHGIGVTNENGERLMDLLEACNLFHGNSFFVKNVGRRWTWESPNAATRSEIDHVLTNRKWSLLDVSVVEAFRTGSDHRLVRAKIRLRAKLRRRDHFRPPPIRLPRYDTSAMEVAAVQYAWQEAQDLTHDYDLLVNGLLHCATASAVSGRANSRSRIDGNARTLLQQRAAVYRNSASSLLERATINKACRIAVRESIQRYKDTQLKEAAEARASLKRCRKDLNDSRSIIAVMRDAMGRPQTSRTKIEEIAVSYYTNLFRSTVSVSRIPTPTQEVAPRIEEWEVERAIRQMKPRKAPGPDRISADFLKSASHTIIKQLTKRFNKYLDAQRIPDQWKKSNTVLLFKKGERDQMKNYRPIALLSQPYKLFTKIILNRLERQLDEYQPVEQAGFRKGFCCMDHIHTITQLRAQRADQGIQTTTPSLLYRLCEGIRQCGAQLCLERIAPCRSRSMLHQPPGTM
uniref:Reverse transcriptase domain-containing protein n=1 Tax=Haemonchus contortus TaxID=6289 RepID=A0A7I4Y7W5_HAECO